MSTTEGGKEEDSLVNIEGNGGGDDKIDALEDIFEHLYEDVPGHGKFRDMLLSLPSTITLMLVSVFSSRQNGLSQGARYEWASW